MGVGGWEVGALSLFVFAFFACAVLVARSRLCCFLNGSRGTMNMTVLQSFVRSVSVRDAYGSFTQGVLEVLMHVHSLEFRVVASVLSRSLAWRVNESTPKLDIATRTERLRVSLSSRSCGSTFAFKNQRACLSSLDSAAPEQSSTVHESHIGQTRLWTAQRSDVDFRDFSTYLVTVRWGFVGVLGFLGCGGGFVDVVGWLFEWKTGHHFRGFSTTQTR